MLFCNLFGMTYQDRKPNWYWIWIDVSVLQFREIQKVAFKLQNPIQKIQQHRWTQKLTPKILVFDYSFQRISQETCQWHSFIVQWCHFFESHNTKKVWWLLYLLSIPYTVCPIWKSLTLFCYYGKANHILVLSMAAFCMILAYILIFKKIFGFCDGWFFILKP